MKIWGLRNIFHAINKVITRPLEIIILACWCLSVSNLSSISTAELRKLALTQLNPAMPGLAKTISKIDFPDGGFAFELEAALMLASTGERILGFDLDITLCDEAYQQQSILACLDGNTELVELRTTEFDIITATHAVECKLGRRAKIQQLTKEKTMIIWCKELVKEIEADQVSLAFTCSVHGKPFIIIRGPATCNHKVHITSEWIQYTTPSDCIDQFKAIVYLLASKEHLTLFGSRVDTEMAGKLTSNYINFQDNVHLATRAAEPDDQYCNMVPQPTMQTTIINTL